MKVPVPALRIRTIFEGRSLNRILTPHKHSLSRIVGNDDCCDLLNMKNTRWLEKDHNMGSGENLRRVLLLRLQRGSAHQTLPRSGRGRSLVGRGFIARNAPRIPSVNTAPLGRTCPRPGSSRPNLTWAISASGPVRRKLRSSGRKIPWGLCRIPVRPFDYIAKAGQRLRIAREDDMRTPYPLCYVFPSLGPHL